MNYVLFPIRSRPRWWKCRDARSRGVHADEAEPRFTSIGIDFAFALDAGDHHVSGCCRLTVSMRGLNVAKLTSTRDDVFDRELTSERETPDRSRRRQRHRPGRPHQVPVQAPCRAALRTGQVLRGRYEQPERGMGSRVSAYWPATHEPGIRGAGGLQTAAQGGAAPCRGDRRRTLLLTPGCGRRPIVSKPKSAPTPWRRRRRLEAVYRNAAANMSEAGGLKDRSRAAGVKPSAV